MATFYPGQTAASYLAALNALANNGSMAVIDAPQTFTALQTFSAGLTVSGGSLTAGAISGTTGTFSGRLVSAVTTGSSAVFDVQNSSATGYGAYIKGGATTQYALRVVNQGGTTVFDVLGSGAVSVTGALGVSGTITSTLSSAGAVLAALSGGTNSQYLGIGNTSGNALFGVNGSTASLITGSTAYDTIIRGKTGISLSGDDGSTQTLRVTAGATSITGYIQGTEMTAPAAGAANTGRVFFQDNGAGKTQMMVIFASGAAQQIAIQP